MKIAQVNLELFEAAAGQSSTSDPIREAEHLLLGLADFAYTQTSLKPMSKVLFLISRCLLLVAHSELDLNPTTLSHRYETVRTSLGDCAPNDDYDFHTVITDCGEGLKHILNLIACVKVLTEGSDGLGLAFHTLLRGKWEGGEGLGTFLTPEEVVQPMVRLVIDSVGDQKLERIGQGPKPLLFGDICGGTGRFVYAIARALEQRGVPKERIGNAAGLFDQSSLAIDFARINFILHGYATKFELVQDSLISDRVSALKDRFLLLATNPPFGTSKYSWSSAVSRELPLEVLRSIGLTRSIDAADPSELFLYRNLDLLAPSGCLAIVLPDGIITTERFTRTLSEYERARGCHVEVLAVVSLPVVTFSLGGTVAKTSFIVIQKLAEKQTLPMYMAVAKHVGFLKRGNRRVPDPNGNELEIIPGDFLSRAPKSGVRVGNWRKHRLLSPLNFLHRARNGDEHGDDFGEPLIKVAAPVRENGNCRHKGQGVYFHIAVTDVDETGLIDIVSASTNRPLTPGIKCRPGDVLVSCINPRLWRVTIIPAINGEWSCSPEFAVFRPKSYPEGWKIHIALHHLSVRDRVISLARGTSSSRQRVPKGVLDGFSLPKIEVDEKTLEEHAASRLQFYEGRLREFEAYAKLHKGARSFAL